MTEELETGTLTFNEPTPIPEGVKYQRVQLKGCELFVQVYDWNTRQWSKPVKQDRDEPKWLSIKSK